MIIDINEKKQNSETEEVKEEMIPVDKWDGSAWKAVWEQFFVPCAEHDGGDPWDYLASFMQQLLGGESNE